ncbi:MAG: NHLP leader peptide family RiPP precursor [Nostochopsis sp.]
MNNYEENLKAITLNMPLWSYQLQQDSKLAVKSRKDLEIDLITRALKDEGFRQELVANPKAVVEKELGAKLPDELEINVLEETEDTLYMLLPCNPYEGISKEDLKTSVGMTYEDIAQWVLEQQRNTLLDNESSMKLMARAWINEVFKQELLSNPVKVIERELGEKIQEGIQLQMFAETTNNLFIVVPRIHQTDALDIEEFSLGHILLEIGEPAPYTGPISNNGPVIPPGSHRPQPSPSPFIP